MLSRDYTKFCIFFGGGANTIFFLNNMYEPIKTLYTLYFLGLVIFAHFKDCDPLDHGDIKVSIIL